MKNITIIKHAIYALLTFTLFFSCSDEWLDRRPKDMIIHEEFWKTKEHLEAGVAGCYRAMIDDSKWTNPDWWTGPVGQMLLWGELRSDNLSAAASISSDERQVMECNITETNRVANWGSVYTVINNCNITLDNADQVMEHDPELTRTEVDAYKAEALAIRSLMYFYLIRTYKEVPLHLEGIRNSQQNFYIGKASEDSIMQQIISDLEWAYDKAVISYDNTTGYAYDKGRFTKTSIAALQADIYLWAKMYPECIEACKTVMSDKRIKMTETKGSIFWMNIVFQQGNSDESIFELQYGNTSYGKVNNTLFQAYGSNDKAAHFYAPLDDTEWSIDKVFTLKSSSDETDVDDFRRTNSYSPSVSISKQAVITKFNNRETTRANWIVYRLAEIYLIKAEALVIDNFEDNKLEALGLINEIYMRSHPLYDEEKELKILDYDTPELMLDLIMSERHKEFLFEGKRWYDLLRLSRRSENPSKVFTDYVIRNIPVEYRSLADTKFKSEWARYMPIPEHDIKYNKNLVQNPFYQTSSEIVIN